MIRTISLEMLTRNLWINDRVEVQRATLQTWVREVNRNDQKNEHCATGALHSSKIQIENVHYIKLYKFDSQIRCSASLFSSVLIHFYHILTHLPHRDPVIATAD